ncbi:hypothetical protein HXA31_20565 [Salipaludibacillus agaradhaerens]|jgi:hypothetical protein|uniref:Uncharacterized protein n=1 Tax=Salipaludibacillus agaradhaerens TaxID=76935 RepID=A0A9Q4B2N8_SALAG|nr:hypothetical protein [Salipaludibacillus agaradhaerens]MCR6096882.1 hypothetical protein [Salipaludibacillus agaradhaerens]MCR6116726.1 hypothetical protein [Salipaludibacillus agaradhaerens]
MNAYRKVFLGILVLPFVLGGYGFSVFWFLNRLFPSMGNDGLAFLTTFSLLSVLFLIYINLNTEEEAKEDEWEI